MFLSPLSLTISAQLKMDLSIQMRDISREYFFKTLFSKTGVMTSDKNYSKRDDFQLY